jgi:hypothetical protein
MPVPAGGSGSRVLVATLDQLKAHLNYGTGTTDDTEMQIHLTAATDYVEWRIGGPVSVQTFTERRWVNGPTLIPRRRPLVSITSITPDFGTALTSTAYVADTDVNQIVFYYTAGGWHTLVYTAGLTVIPFNVELAGLIVAAHLWQTQNGFAGRRNSDDLVVTGLGFAVPRRAEELLNAGNAMAGVS